jgi:hypothetical protein
VDVVGGNMGFCFTVGKMVEVIREAYHGFA